jgi:glycerol-3-phosphate dehydrogenase
MKKLLMSTLLCVVLLSSNAQIKAEDKAEQEVEKTTKKGCNKETRKEKANEKIVIKAGTPVATIIPISLTQLNNTIINIVEYKDEDRKRVESNISYGEAAQVINASGEWTDWYRNAVNEKNESLGNHEAKTLKLIVKDNTNGDII